MVKKIIATGLVALLTGCSTYRPHTTSEKAWLVGMIAGQGSDYLSTDRGLRAEATELNPLIDDMKDVAILKISTTGLIYLIGQIDPKHRTLYYKMGAFIGGTQGLWNTYQMEK